MGRARVTVITVPIGGARLPLFLLLDLPSAPTDSWRCPVPARLSNAYSRIGFNLQPVATPWHRDYTLRLPRLVVKAPQRGHSSRWQKLARHGVGQVREAHRD